MNIYMNLLNKYLDVLSTFIEKKYKNWNNNLTGVQIFAIISLSERKLKLFMMFKKNV